MLPGPPSQRILIISQGAFFSDYQHLTILMIMNAGVLAATNLVTALGAYSYLPVPDALCIEFSNPAVITRSS